MTFRKLLNNKEIDAISTATPNHWHAADRSLGCQAGKDVYVEKPISHDVWEGRKAVEAARKYSRIVQAGTRIGPTRLFAKRWNGCRKKIRQNSVWRAVIYNRRSTSGKLPRFRPFQRESISICGAGRLR